MVRPVPRSIIRGMNAIRKMRSGMMRVIKGDFLQFSQIPVIFSPIGNLLPLIEYAQFYW
jgi:hypothetical protein